MPEDAALEVACSFGYPELTAVQLTSAAHVDDVSAAAWDPTVGGLPADLTEDLSQQVLPDCCSALPQCRCVHALQELKISARPNQQLLHSLNSHVSFTLWHLIGMCPILMRQPKLTERMQNGRSFCSQHLRECCIQGQQPRLYCKDKSQGAISEWQAGKPFSAADDREDPASSAAQPGGTATWDEVRQAAPKFRAEAGAASEQARPFSSQFNWAFMNAYKLLWPHTAAQLASRLCPILRWAWTFPWWWIWGLGRCFIPVLQLLQSNSQWATSRWHQLFSTAHTSPLPAVWTQYRSLLKIFICALLGTADITLIWPGLAGISGDGSGGVSCFTGCPRRFDCHYSKGWCCCRAPAAAARKPSRKGKISHGFRIIEGADVQWKHTTESNKRASSLYYPATALATLSSISAGAYHSSWWTTSCGAHPTVHLEWAWQGTIASLSQLLPSIKCPPQPLQSKIWVIGKFACVQVIGRSAIPCLLGTLPFECKIWMIKMLACTQANREKAMKAAGTLAVGLAAGVVMSALAIDLTDAAVAGAILAAGALL